MSMTIRGMNLKPCGIALLAIAAVTALASCSAGSSAGATRASALTIADESGSPWSCGFNPFNANVSYISFGYIYEPLYFVDTLKNAKQTPWLASGYRWSDGNKTLTWTIRKGVSWNDGQPFTARDVVYTFNLLKTHPALDLNSIWSVLVSVTQSGTDSVVMKFRTPALPYFYYVADQTPIIPEHIWSKISNPVTFGDSHPVGTGPYVIQSCTPQDITYVKNRNYWQRGLPKVSTIEEPAYISNVTANEALSTGTAQLGAQFIPNLRELYLSKSSSNHYWFPPVVNEDVFLNLKNPQLANVAVRRAIAYAIDRQRVAQVAEYGEELPANQTGIVTPTFSNWLDAGVLASMGKEYDPARAVSILQKAGFKRGPNGIFETSAGTPLSFTIIDQGGETDSDAAIQIVASELRAVGIATTTQELAYSTYDADLFDGRYQLAYGYETGGPTPYYELRQLLYSGNTAPIGQAASSNYERYSNPSTDALFNQYAEEASSSNQHTIVDQLEKVMIDDVPVVPVTELVDWYEYSTASYTGWVTPSDPYAQPAAYVTPDIEVLLLHLRPKKG
jgi:peptide/nickel transport system substrate-binding protein